MEQSGAFMLRLPPILAFCLALALSACGSREGVAQEKGPRGPVETNAPNAPDQKPAFAGQTRAPQPAQLSQVAITPFAEGLDTPWGIAALPDGRFLVTEKGGRLRVVMPDGRVLGPVDGIPAVDSRGQGGLLDVVARPDPDGAFTVCLSYAEPRGGDTNATAAACARASGAENLALEPLRVVFRQEPPWRSTGHFGSRLAFAPDGSLFITTGDRQRPDSRAIAQRMDNTFGKVVRVGVDGSTLRDNPFAAQGGPAAQIWSLGHRNLQSAAIRPATGDLWTVEHGPRGGDELNRPQAGRNYGWPVITYGIDYNGQKMGEGTAKAGLEQPVYYWDPVIAPSGLLFHSGRLFPQWRDSALIGSTKNRYITRLTLNGDRVMAEERIPVDGVPRDLDEGPDGAVYVLLGGQDGKIVKLTPKA